MKKLLSALAVGLFVTGVAVANEELAGTTMEAPAAVEVEKAADHADAEKAKPAAHHHKKHHKAKKNHEAKKHHDEEKKEAEMPAAQ
jgi:hypothetical protein